MPQDHEPFSDSADTDINQGGDPVRSDPVASEDGGRGSSRTPSGVARKQYPEKDRTIISSRPPIYSPEHEQLGPKELGQTLVGRRLAHFELREFVGGGGMGAVFRAVDTMLQRHVAVKVLSRDQSSDDETVRRFRNEAQSAARLDHENIARVYFVGEEDGWYFIVFEFIDGTNIRDLVAHRGLLEAQEAFDFTLQIAEALNHAAERNVVHRDIKPSNVLITHDGRAKLVDMGLARLHQVQSESNDLTATGVTLGTFDYISPEQARDPRVADVRSDIYSLGCTLFYMLTGRPPFPDGTVLQKLLSHSGDVPPDPREWRKDIPIELSSVLSRMLAKKPSDRYQHPSDLIGELLAMGERLGWRTATRGEPIFIAATKSRFRWVELHLPWVVPSILFVTFMLFVDSIQISEAGVSYGKTEFSLPKFTSNQHELPVALPSDDFEMTTANPKKVQDSADQDSGQLPAADVNEDEANSIADSDKATLNDSAQNGSPKSTASRVDSRERVYVSSDKTNSSLDGYAVYGSLAEAVNAARRKEIDLVELRLNEAAVVDLPEVGFDLTIRAAPGYSPTLRFNGEFAREMQSMFQVAAELTLEGVDLEMSVPMNPGRQRWTMFEMTSFGALRLEDCTITVRNSDGGRRSYLPDVAVVRLGYSSSDVMLAAETEIDYAAISVNNTAVRGEATFLKSASPESFRLTWSDGLFLSTEQLINVVSANNPVDLSLTIDIQLDRLTAIADGGLAEFRENNFNRQRTQAKLSLENSIVRTKTWSALVTHSGSGVDSDLESFLKFRGSNNLYDDVSTFWKTIAVTGRSDSIKFADWQAVTADDSKIAELQWPMQVINDLPVSEHSSRLYRLDPSANVAIGDGEQETVGFAESREFPSEDRSSNQAVSDGVF